MKRSTVGMVCVFALVCGVYFGTRLTAKPAPELAIPAQTRVAMLNLRLVIKNYAAYQKFIDEMKEKEAKYVEQLTAMKNQLDELAKKAETAEKERDAIEAQSRQIQSDMEAIKEKAKKEVKVRSETEMVKVYKKIRDTASRFAKSNNIQLVFHYEGPADEAEVDSPVLVTRNMNAGGCVPYYFDPSMDISNAVLEIINKDYKKEGN